MKTPSQTARSSSSSSSSSSIDVRSKRARYSIDEKDLISKLPDELLHMTLSRLSTAEAVRTNVLSSRWVDLWRWRPTLELDMRRDLAVKIPLGSQNLDRQSTKVINNHRGDLESCSIHHYMCQLNDGTLGYVIHAVTRLKKAKELTLVNCPERYGYNILRMDPDTFSYPNLTSLSLCRFRLLGPCAFQHCSNLKTLKLKDITISRATVLSKVLAACSSVDLIVLELRTVDRIGLRGVLKIENNNLKYLQVIFRDKIGRFQVYASSLDVLDIRFIKCERDYDFVLDAPNLRFNRNYWTNHGFPYSHMSYNISYLAQEKRSVWHKLMVSDIYHKRHGSLSISVDVTDPKEVEILKEVLFMWSEEIKELEILFKEKNASKEKGINGGRAHNKLWNDTKPFPYADFRVHTVWMYNFDSSIKEEFALASQFVTHKMMTEKMMVQASKYPLMKKLKVQADMAKLRQLSKRLGNEDFTIECF